MLAVTILGNNSAIPAFQRHPTSQVVHTSETSFLIDCGEGTQMQMDLYKIRRSKINHILISHLHGDHYFGLIGLLTSMSLLGRKHDINLYAPRALKDLIALQLSIAGTELCYQLNFFPLEEIEVMYDSSKLIVRSFQVKHRIPCWGFIFKEKKHKRKINPDAVKHYHVPLTLFEDLRNGRDVVVNENQHLSNELLTTSVMPGKSYAYCSDTIYDEGLIQYIQNTDLVYHEATYLHEFKDKAAARFHTTCFEAATLAKKSNVKKLLIGHFSSKYENLDVFKEEACAVFPQTELAIEGCTFIA